MKEITVQELKQLRDEKADFFLLDVREPFEYDICNLGGHLIPLAELPSRLAELDPQQKIIVHCKMGGRSSRATLFLEQHGFNNVSNLQGGLMAWVNEIEPSLKKY
jgi:rhodanese-related sulfurtransferase